MRYVNSTRATRTFYGIEIKPNEVKEFPGYINVTGFYPVEAEAVSEKEAEEAEQAQPKEQVEVKTVKSKKSKDGEN